MMYQPVDLSANDRLFEALKEVFLRDPTHALETSKDVGCLIASFVVDMAATSENPNTIEAALMRIDEMRSELDELAAQLATFKKLKPDGYRH